MGCQIWSPKASHLPALSRTEGTLPRREAEHHIPLCRDGDDPLSVKSLFIVIITVEKPKQADMGPAQLCFLWERINKLQQV